MKKILIFAAVFVLCLGNSAFAANPAAEPAAEKRETADRHKEMVQKFEEMQTKFKALSLEEKKEIYAIHDEIVKLQVSLFDRYTKSGVMTTDEANAVRNRIVESNKRNKENGLMPGTHQKKSQK